jgi:hypothetical protein
MAMSSMDGTRSMYRDRAETRVNTAERLAVTA